MRIDSLRETLPLVFEHKARIADHFFQSMFHHAPETRAYFTEGFGRKKAILATMIAKIAQTADQPDTLDRIAGGLANSHRAYGITQTQYQAARRALKEALTLHLSDHLSGQELAAWTNVADAFVQRMIDLTR